ncbi:MAG TPA: alanine--glyoxylate aminotransferase family protein [Polyangia bacterium]|nr:alanine--glyoxylate aminotransferase family protein [Polyangia bacterium]
MLKQYLLTAGPTPVPERVALAMAQPVLYHRAPAFAEVLKEALAGLKWVFQTTQPVIVLAGSGTSGMEAAVVNFLSRGDKAICIRGGKFGERWSNLCTAHGVQVINLDVEWGQAVRPADVQALLDREGDVRAVFATASESSTGVAHPVGEIAELVRARDTLCVVDAVSALGAFDVPMDKWGIDVLVTGSQKALMLPPGLAFVGVSEKAWGACKRANLPRFYLDLARERKSQDKGETAFTPAISLVVGLCEALRMLKEEGLDNVFARHLKLADATRKACAALGCQLFAASPAPSVTAVRVPAGVDGSALVKHLRTRYGITIAGGQDHLKGKIFRIAHLGYFGTFDILTAISGVEMTLADLGYSFELGSGIRAAEQVLRVGV